MGRGRHRRLGGCVADPTDTWCARVASFDPAYRLFADDVLTGPRNRWLPRVADVVPLEGEGYAVIMERLWSADAGVAQGFCDALRVPDETGRDGERPAPVAFPKAADPDFAALRVRVGGLLARGEARYPRLWGGSDIRAGNVMVTADGDLKLVDPVIPRRAHGRQGAPRRRHGSVGGPLPSSARGVPHDRVLPPGARPLRGGRPARRARPARAPAAGLTRERSTRARLGAHTTADAIDRSPYRWDSQRSAPFASAKELGCEATP
jgi:hypothetical protein